MYETKEIVVLLSFKSKIVEKSWREEQSPTK